jgi:hypothetical protein
MLTTMCYAKQRDRGPCGFWFGFGSHMLFDRKMTDKIIKILIDEILTKPKQNYLGTDEVIGLCLEGNHPQCLECLADSSMVAPTRLLFRYVIFSFPEVIKRGRQLKTFCLADTLASGALGSTKINEISLEQMIVHGEIQPILLGTTL